MAEQKFSYKIRRIQLNQKNAAIVEAAVLPPEAMEILEKMAKTPDAVPDTIWNSTLEVQIDLEKGLLQ